MFSAGLTHVFAALMDIYAAFTHVCATFTEYCSRHAGGHVGVRVYLTARGWHLVDLAATMTRNRWLFLLQEGVR
jgi:hypothetical protein